MLGWFTPTAAVIFWYSGPISNADFRPQDQLKTICIYAVCSSRHLCSRMSRIYLMTAHSKLWTKEVKLLAGLICVDQILVNLINVYIFLITSRKNKWKFFFVIKGGKVKVHKSRNIWLISRALCKRGIYWFLTIFKLFRLMRLMIWILKKLVNSLSENKKIGPKGIFFTKFS